VAMDWKSLLLGTAIGLFFDKTFDLLLADRLKNWMENRSLVSKRKRINQLNRELDFITKINENKEKFVLGLIEDFFLILLCISFGILFTFISSQLSSKDIGAIVFMIISLSFAAFLSSSKVLTISKVKRFDDYKKQVQDRIKQLSLKG
jgi:hypothetical protein